MGERGKCTLGIWKWKDMDDIEGTISMCWLRPKQVVTDGWEETGESTGYSLKDWKRLNEVNFGRVFGNDQGLLRHMTSNHIEVWCQVPSWGHIRGDERRQLWIPGSPPTASLWARPALQAPGMGRAAPGTAGLGRVRCSAFESKGGHPNCSTAGICFRNFTLVSYPTRGI